MSSTFSTISNIDEKIVIIFFLVFLFLKVINFFQFFLFLAKAEVAEVKKNLDNLKATLERFKDKIDAFIKAGVRSIQISLFLSQTKKKQCLNYCYFVKFKGNQEDVRELEENISQISVKYKSTSKTADSLIEQLSQSRIESSMASLRTESSSTTTGSHSAEIDPVRNSRCNYFVVSHFEPLSNLVVEIAVILL